MSPRSCWLAVSAVFAALVCIEASRASETDRIGGGGGDYSVRMECGPDAFLVGFSAGGGAYHIGDMNLVRRLQFRCRSFGVDPYATQIPGVYPRYWIMNETEASVDCGEGEALYWISGRALLYVDSLRTAVCRHRSGRPFQIDFQVGGGGGLYASLLCPDGEALYRVDARAGNAIDSLKGYCRRFPPPQVDPNAPAFDEAPAQGAIIGLSALNGGEIPLRAHGIVGPVTLSLQVMSPYASRFELVAPSKITTSTGTRLSGTQLSLGAATISTSRILRMNGPVIVNPLAGSPTVPIALTVRDGAGRTTVRTFQVSLR